VISIFLNYVTFFIHPYLLDPIDPSIAQSMDQLISAQFTERKQSKHFLEEYESLRKYTTTQPGPGQQGCSHANHCFISGRSWTEYCCLVYLYKILDTVL
jgi:hypothetical protein